MSIGRADAEILVKVDGDADGLERELNDGDRALGRFSTGNVAKVGAVVAGAFATGAIVEFGATAFAESERASDALGRLEATLGGPLAQQLADRADDFAVFGQSKQDILELEGIFADIATSLGVAGPPLADFTGRAAEAAAALSTLNGGEPADWIDKIAKAATLGEDDLAALGIHLTEAEVQSRALRDTGKGTVDMLTDAELASAAYDLILEKLNPKIETAAGLTGDLSDKQAEVNAKWETFTGEVGGFLEGPADDLTDWLLEGVDGWKLFGDAVGSSEDRLRGVFGLLAAIGSLAPGPAGSIVDRVAPTLGNAGAPRGGTTSHPRGGADVVVVQVPDTLPDATERAAVEGIRTYNRQNGHE